MDPKRAAEQLGGRRAAKGQDDDEEEVVEERAAASPLTPAQQEAIKQLDRKLAQAESEIEQATPVKGVDADLTLPNAVGPETHLYHGMAIHLYAKR
jgi:hypothetical protein